jgi:enoyl-CoA hydratase/carnithine racemase
MPVTYRLEDNIATLTLDDGKMNALSVDMLSEIGGALDRAKEEDAVVILTGREGVFSAGSPSASRCRISASRSAASA